MPNTPALMQHGVTGLFPNELVNDEQKTLQSSWQIKKQNKVQITFVIIKSLYFILL